MKSSLERIAIVLNWSYAALMLAWFIAHDWLGDLPWWLGLMNSFAPFLFIPLLPLAGLTLAIRKRAYAFALVPPLLIFLFLYGALFLPAWPKPKGDDSLTVMTFNVWGFSETPETAQAILQNGTPDIVVMQEVSAQFSDVLIDELGDIYPYRLFKLHERADSGLAIFSQHPMTAVTPDSFTNWRVLIGEVTTDGRSLRVYNIHPTVSNMLIALEDGDSLALDIAQSTGTREAQIRAVVADIEEQEQAIIVAGDMNTTDQSRAYRLLARQLNDAHRITGWGFGHSFPAYGGNWRGLPIIPKQLRIDMIWYSDALSSTSCQVGAEYGESDHRPVIAELQWRE